MNNWRNSDYGAKRYFCTFAAGILVLALLVRVVYVFLAPSVDPLLQRTPYYGDASGYHLLASNLLEGKGYTFDGESPTSFRMPGYPLFLAAMYSIAGRDPGNVRLIQAFLGALACSLVFLIAVRVGGYTTALIAGLMIAFHPVTVFITGWLYSETIFILLLTAAIWSLFLLKKPVWIRGLLAGGFLGSAIYFRPEVFVLPIFILGFTLLFRAAKNFRRPLLLAQLIVVLMVLPWVIRNAYVHGEFVPLATNSGVVLFGGNNEGAEGGFHLDGPFVMRGMSEAESSRQYARQALEFIYNEPGNFLRLIPAKLIRFFSLTRMEHSGPALGPWSLPIDILYGLFLLVALAGAIRGLSEQNGMILILVAFVAWYTLIATILYGGARVALPTVPPLSVLGAYGAVFLTERFTRWSGVFTGGRPRNKSLRFGPAQVASEHSQPEQPFQAKVDQRY